MKTRLPDEVLTMDRARDWYRILTYIDHIMLLVNAELSLHDSDQPPVGHNDIYDWVQECYQVAGNLYHNTL